MLNKATVWLNSFKINQASSISSNIRTKTNTIGIISVNEKIHKNIYFSYIGNYACSEINCQSSIGVFNLLDNLGYMNYTSIGYIGNAK